MNRVFALVPAVLIALASGRFADAVEIDVALDPELDTVGQQVIAVQAYTPTAGGQPIIDLGLYDTGASVVTYSWFSNQYFPQPHLNPGGAGGAGINGSVTGDVSQPGSMLVGGLQDFDFLFDPDTFEFSGGIITPVERTVPGVQVFVASETGSPSLPTLAGTPVHGPSAAFAAGSAARITMTGIDFGTSLGLGVPLTFPKLDLVAPGTTLTAGPGRTAPARIPLSPFGTGNRGSEGQGITVAPNPTFTNVTLGYTAASGSTATTTASRLLFDTGAQVSLISGSLAAALGLDLARPDDSIRVQGASGVPITLPGFILDALALAAAIDDEAVDDVVRFANVPVFVYDLGIPGLDGILGMNLYNQADELIVDLVNDELSVSFLENPAENSGGSMATLALLFGNSPAFAGQIVPAFGLGSMIPVPEPSTLVGLTGAAVACAGWYRRRTRRRRPTAQPSGMPVGPATGSFAASQAL